MSKINHLISGGLITNYYCTSKCRHCLYACSPSWKKQYINENQYPCKELFDTSHFHADLFGNYIPGLCSGLSINIDDLGKPLNQEKYPLLTQLMENGINGLYELACKEYGFTTKQEYISKCELCSHIRQFIVIEKNIDSLELKPEEFYIRA